jgi:hypothetical protein
LQYINVTYQWHWRLEPSERKEYVS